MSSLAKTVSFDANTIAIAYGWNDYTAEMPDEEILRRLLVLNLECPH